MKANQRQRRTWIAAGIAGACLIGITAWQQVPVKDEKPSVNYHDTIPGKNKSATRDLDRELRQLSEAAAAIGTLSEKDWPDINGKIKIDLSGLDIESALNQAENALAKLDGDKLSAVIESARISIDFDKLSDVIEKSLANLDQNIDKEEIRRELADAKVELKRELESAKQVTAREVQQAISEARKEIADVNMVEIKAALKDAQRDIDEALADISVNEKEIKSSVTRAREEIKEAEAILKGYQEMIYLLEDEKLLTTEEDYTITFNKGRLSVNGKDVDQQTTDKYKKYFNNKDIEIKKRAGKVDINQRN